MFSYLLDVVCSCQEFPGMDWAWTPSENVVNVYYKFLSECSYRGIMARLFDQFIAPLYTMIFEQDLTYMSHATMEALLNIVDWFASLDGTFIRMYNVEKVSHVLPNFPWTSWSCRRFHTTSRQGYQLDYTGRRMHQGLCFLCELGCMWSKVWKKQMLRSRTSRSLSSTPRGRLVEILL